MTRQPSLFAFSKSGNSCYQWHGDHGPVIVLIHGLGLNRHMWQWQIPALSRNHRVLSYDLYGHGQTPRADQKHSLTVFAQQIILMLDEFNIEHCGLAGFSLGGMIARRCAMDYPQRVQALAILNSPHARTESQQQAIMKRVQQVTEQGPSATVDAAIERWFTNEYHELNPQVINLVKQWVLANDPAVYPENYQVLATGVEELVAPKPPISCPALVVAAQDDFGQPAEMAQAIAAEIPNAAMHVLPRLRHMALVEAPEQYNQLLQSFFKQMESVQTQVGDDSVS